jgi:DNA-binding XRE family transcriptional regulator
VRYDLSQEKLAELADIHVTTLGLIENGKMAPSLKTIVKIANALGVTLCAIMNIDE